MKLQECDNVNRIEIIDGSGRVFVTDSYRTEVQLQDKGLTLKVFIDQRPYSELYRRKSCGSKAKMKHGNTGSTVMNMMENMKDAETVLTNK